jgi:NitT/TauT family transport system substrate-binding protein
VAYEKGFLAEAGIDATLYVTPTAWLIPEQLASGATDFAVLPWTRVAASEAGEAPLKVLCGSGCEEAVVVVRNGLTLGDVRTVAVPREGGMKDLTAMGLIESLGWDRCDLRRFPSGDGAVIAFVGEGCDAASMIEPYGAMMERLGIGTPVRRTGDIWPGAPGCSLAASAALITRDPELVQRVVNVYVQAAAWVDQHLDEASTIAAPYIGVHPTTVRKALDVNKPNINAVRNTDSMNTILALMKKLGYVQDLPRDYANLSFLDIAQQGPSWTGRA